LSRFQPVLVDGRYLATMFYSVVLLAVAGLAHAVMMPLVTRWAPKWRVPALLVFPNAEVALLAVLLPGVAFSSAKLAAAPNCNHGRLCDIVGGLTIVCVVCFYALVYFRLNTVGSASVALFSHVGPLCGFHMWRTVLPGGAVPALCAAYCSAPDAQRELAHGRVW
jgi:hypothetical protein